MQQMINKDTSSQCTLQLHGYMQLVSHTPLKRLIENGGSLSASKRVSGTQARLRIEGVWCLGLCNTGGWVRYFGIFQWQLTSQQMVSTSRELVTSLD